MKITTIAPSGTKQCPFCAEIIQAAAVKCRFCGEFLDDRQNGALQTEPEISSEDGPAEDQVLFSARPSLFARAGSLMRLLIILAGGGLLAYFPFESIAGKLLELNLAENKIAMIDRYRVFVGVGIAAIAGLFLLVKIIKLKAVCYEITADRVEWSRGILSRKYDKLDMFRVVDLKLRRSLFDCIAGVGRVTLITTDKTDPKFVFEKTRRARELYDVIKKASLDAALQGGVLHVEKD